MSQHMQNPLLRSQPEASVAPKILFQRKSSCPSSPQRGLWQQRPTLLALNSSQYHLNKLLLFRTTHNDESKANRHDANPKPYSVVVARLTDAENAGGETGSTTTRSMLFFALKYDSNQDTITSLIDPSRSLSYFATHTIPPSLPDSLLSPTRNTVSSSKPYLDMSSRTQSIASCVSPSTSTAGSAWFALSLHKRSLTIPQTVRT